jgi:hypothetical protein
MKDWGRYGYSGANSTNMEQILKNIRSGFWKRVDSPGYFDEHPEELRRLNRPSMDSIVESNDFEWAEDIPLFNPLERDWVIFFHNRHEYVEIQKYLFSHNLCWDGHYLDNEEAEDCGEPWPADGKHGFFFMYPEDTHSGGIDAYSYSDRELERGEMDNRIESDFPNHKQYKWSDIGHYFMNEDFDWVNDVPDYDAYRFFDVYTCDDNQYDEETGEDECLGGGSYFLRIPKEEVEEIWDLDIDDMGGPGDEGLGVIEWGERNDKFDPDDYAMVQYVREIDRTEFCQAVRHSNQDICGDFFTKI